jgi:hypothetical protein
MYTVVKLHFSEKEKLCLYLGDTKVFFKNTTNGTQDAKGELMPYAALKIHCFVGEMYTVLSILGFWKRYRNNLALIYRTEQVGLEQCFLNCGLLVTGSPWRSIGWSVVLCSQYTVI